MVTFCLGSARAKRAYIKKIEDAVLLDNIEVLFCVSENGRNYFAYAPVPFSEFSVYDFLMYRRALCGDKVATSDIKRLGINPKAKIGRLPAAARRGVQFLEKTCGHTARPVVINLDGIRYTRRNAAALKRLLSALQNDAYVFVTDNRFKKRFRGSCATMAFGKQAKTSTHRFYNAKLMAEKAGANKISIM